MGKPKLPSFRNSGGKHKQRIEKYTALIQQVYDKAADEAARIALLTGADPSKQFFFSDFPEIKYAVTKLQQNLFSDLEAIVYAGTSNEWKESNLLQDLVANKVIKAYSGKSNAGNEYSRYFQYNKDALEAFQERRVSGLRLSQRIWNLEEQAMTDLEMGISAGLEKGISAAQLSVQLKQYLDDPELMFRRFRYKDENGDWQRKWKRRYIDDEGKVRFVDCDKHSYKTEKGYYKSASKNAKRLARTEINMAYRTAEQKRWEQFDFVVGYEVHTTQNGHHVTDICDELAGKYPKGFHFTGWHPQCMCYAVPILKTEDEFWSYDPENPVPSENEVAEPPEGFIKWVKENKDRIEKAEKLGNLPYFLSDNKEYWEKAETQYEPAIYIGEKEYRIKEIIAESQIIETENGKVYLHPKHGKNERAYNEEIAKWRANNFGEEIILLPNPNNITSADSYNITRQVVEEYKSNNTATINSIDNLIRKGSKQANNIILEINSDIKAGDVRNALQDRVNRCENLDTIRLKIGEYEAVYTRDEILSEKFKIKLEDFRKELSQSRGTSLDEQITEVKLINFFENTKNIQIKSEKEH